MHWLQRILMLVVFSCSVLVFFNGCQKECKPGEDLECWLAALKNPDQTKNAVENIKQLGSQKDEPALIELFAAPATEPDMRESLAEMFHKWKSKAAVKPMIAALDYTVGPNKDGHKAKRTNRANQKIASALGAIGDASAVNPLMRLMKTTKDEYVQRAAARALGELKAKEAVDELIRVSEDTTVHPNIRMNAIYALGAIGDAKAIPGLVIALYRDKAYYFQHAALALVRIGEPAIDLLVKTMNGENPDAKRITDENVEVLAGALEANAAQVLGAIGSPKAAEPLLKMAEKVGKWEEQTNRLLVMSRIMMALGDIGDPSAIKLLMFYIDYQDPSTKEFLWDIRTICANGINSISDRSIVAQLLKSIAKGGHPRTRAPLIEAISNLGTDEALPKMTAMQATEKDVDLQPIIQDAIKRLQAYAQCKQNANCWIGKLSDKEIPVREKAIYELGRLGDPKVIDALRKLIGDDSENVRFALIWALGKLKSQAPIADIETQLEKEKGSARFTKVNMQYQLLIARLNRIGQAGQ